jgi:hypothetical protein
VAIVRVALGEALHDLGLEGIQQLGVAEALGEPAVLEPALVPSPIPGSAGSDGALPPAVRFGRAAPPVDADDQADADELEHVQDVLVPAVGGKRRRPEREEHREGAEKIVDHDGAAIAIAVEGREGIEAQAVALEAGIAAGREAGRLAIAPPAWGATAIA